MMQALQSVKLEHSSTGRRWTLSGVETGGERDMKGLAQSEDCYVRAVRKCLESMREMRG